jgi:uncharacterized membrane protein
MLLVLKNTLALIAPLGVGLLAGILVGTGMAQFTAQGLAESSWVMRFQLEDQLFAKVMPPLMLSTLIALIAFFALSDGHARWWLGASIVFTLLVLAITIGYEVPLNRQIQSWTPGAVPSDWRRVRDLWLQRHLMRTVAGLLAFICSLASRTA